MKNLKFINYNKNNRKIKSLLIMKKIIEKLKKYFRFKIESVIKIDEILTIEYSGENKFIKWLFFKFISNIKFEQYKDEILFRTHNIGLSFLSSKKTLTGESVKFKLVKYDDLALSKLLNNDNIEVKIQFKINNVLSYYCRITECFLTKKNKTQLLSKEHIDNIKDLIKRVENLPDNRIVNNKCKFSKEEVINIIKKYSDVDSPLIRKMESIGISIKSVLYSMYIDYDQNDYKNRRIISPAILFINNKKMKGQPINVDNGFVITGKNHDKILSKNKKSSKLEYVKGFITDDNLFIDEKMAIELVKITRQVIELFKKFNIEDLIEYDKN